MVLDQELKLTDDCIIRLSEIKEYIDQELLSISCNKSRLVLKDSVQNMLLDLYQILDKDLW
jgi:hypothetical protein